MVSQEKHRCEYVMSLKAAAGGAQRYARVTPPIYQMNELRPRERMWLVRGHQVRIRSGSQGALCSSSLGGQRGLRLWCVRR